jgi:hypothetical protein
MIQKITNYGQYSSDNYGAHTLKVDLGEIEFYYSYETIVAYCDGKDGRVCSVNQWGTTTGKHLNWIEPNKKYRKDAEQFDSMLKAAIERHVV